MMVTNHSNIMMVYKKVKKVIVVDVTIPRDSNIRKKDTRRKRKANN